MILWREYRRRAGKASVCLYGLVKHVSSETGFSLSTENWINGWQLNCTLQLHWSLNLDYHGLKTAYHSFYCRKKPLFFKQHFNMRDIIFQVSFADLDETQWLVEFLEVQLGPNSVTAAIKLLKYFLNGDINQFYSKPGFTVHCGCHFLSDTYFIESETGR